MFSQRPVNSPLIAPKDDQTGKFWVKKEKGTKSLVPEDAVIHRDPPLRQVLRQ